MANLLHSNGVRRVCMAGGSEGLGSKQFSVACHHTSNNQRFYFQFIFKLDKSISLGKSISGTKLGKRFLSRSKFPWQIVLLMGINGTLLKLSYGNNSQVRHQEWTVNVHWVNVKWTGSNTGIKSFSVKIGVLQSPPFPIPSCQLPLFGGYYFLVR